MLLVYKRRGADEFLKFCFENFVVGVWSSAQEHNVRALVDFVFGPSKSELAFIWTDAQCTKTGLTHPTKKKPLVRRELSKLWNGEHGVPWKKGVFGPSNTTLIDDDPTKIVDNPPNTAILFKTYKVTDPEDHQLEKLQDYLELLAEAEDVQKYMESNPFEKFEPRQRIKSVEDVEDVDVPSSELKLDDSESLDSLISKALSLNVSDGSSSTTLPPSPKKTVKGPVSPLSSKDPSSQEERRQDGKQMLKSPSTESGRNVSIKVYSYPKAVKVTSKKDKARWSREW
ncbi:hypothetical protein R1sor_004431 [Riccia sorocarpa]|uniref:Mitochondrial import inner membrane translocase subunit TIM50 n=1 Tax=Riccia sorocarpa TaxID=122646 RepID=A0ABD3HGQ6_9MARC